MSDTPDPETIAIIEALDEAITTAGSALALASGIKVSASLPSMWRQRGKVPPEHAPAIERLTRERHAEDPSKKIVVCERLAPRTDWAVLRLRAVPDEQFALRCRPWIRP
jgi:DNA-binding transcriptional regulator YdaS (Cro superfamily)